VRTASGSDSPIVELGWLVSATLVILAALQALPRIVAERPMSPTVPAGRSLAFQEVERPVLDVARLAALLGLPIPSGCAPRRVPPLHDAAGPELEVREVETTDDLWEPASSAAAGTTCGHPEVRIVQVSRDGHPTGLALRQIRPGSWPARLGLVEGDIVRRVNGLELTSPERALEAYTRLKDEERIVLELERGGAPLRKTYVRHLNSGPSRSPGTR